GQGVRKTARVPAPLERRAAAQPPARTFAQALYLFAADLGTPTQDARTGRCTKNASPGRAGCAAARRRRQAAGQPAVSSYPKNNTSDHKPPTKPLSFATAAGLVARVPSSAAGAA